jgi:hypothetical protein
MAALLTPGLVLLCWLPFSRVPWLRWLFIGYVVALAALGTVLLHVVPRAGAEVAFGTAAAGVVAALTCWIYERDDPRPKRWFRWPAGVLAGLLVPLYGFAFLDVITPAPFYPPTGDVLPVPAGLHAEVTPRSAGDCGTAVCEVTIKVTGDSALPRLRQHLVERGFRSACRPAGLWLDTTTECVELLPTAYGADIVLEGSRDRIGSLPG